MPKTDVLPCSVLVPFSAGPQDAAPSIRSCGSRQAHTVQVRHGMGVLAGTVLFVLAHVALITGAAGIAALNADASDIVATALK